MKEKKIVNQELDTQPKYLSKMKKEEFIQKKKTKGINLQQTYSTKNVKGISQIEGI